MIQIHKRIVAGLVLLCGLLSVFPAVAHAAEAGAYTVETVTHYLNPDTGVTDDGGSKNAAVGEGMSRSIVDPTALVEVDAGKTYLTLRMLLLTNLRDLTFAVQRTAGDPNSYETVTAEVMQEDAANDAADYRFSIPAVGGYVRCIAYVIPMGRQVQFYLNTSTKLTPYSGDDFVVSVQRSAKKVENTTTEAKTKVAAAKPATGAEPASAKQSAKPPAIPAQAVPKKDAASAAVEQPQTETTVNAKVTEHSQEPATATKEAPASSENASQTGTASRSHASGSIAALAVAGLVIGITAGLWYRKARRR